MRSLPRKPAPLHVRPELLEDRCVRASLSIRDVTLLEGNSGARSAFFMVTLSAPSRRPVSVHYATGNGTATASDHDYRSVAGTLTFRPGQVSARIAVPIFGDTRPEADEAFVIRLSQPMHASLARRVAFGNILNDDNRITIADTSVTSTSSGPVQAVFDLEVAPAGRAPISVHYTTLDGTASADAGDYTAAEGIVTFRPGQPSATIAIDVAAVSAFGPSKTFGLQLSQPSGALLAVTNATGTILNGNPQPAPSVGPVTQPQPMLPTLSIGSVTQAEGNSGTTQFSFPVTLSSASSTPVSVNFATADGSATVADGDYQATNGTLTFPANVTSQNAIVNVNGDTKVEADDTFQVTLLSPVGAVIANATATGSITNDDQPPALTLSIGDVTQAEGNSGTTQFSFPVTLSGASGAPVTVNFATGDGSATVADNDYQAASGSLTFPANTTTQNALVIVNGDTKVEPDETFQVTLSSAVGAVIANGTATGTITNDDQTSPASGPQILLDAATLTRLRTMASDNTPQWQAFKSQLDSNLDVHIAYETGAYQASETTYITDYALGYQILKDPDPLTAANYADKAISLMKSGLNDYQKGSWVGEQYLASGDGVKQAFTLPNTDIHPGTLQVFLSAITTQPVVHGAQDGQDTVDSYRNFLAVSSTPQGPPDFTQGVDWRYNADFGNDQLDWSLRGQEPASGATYYVTSTSGYLAIRLDPAAYTVNGNVVTFNTAPSATQAVFVQYIYGTHSADGSTLNYQETSAGDGGFNSIFVDDTYTGRYLGKHLATGLDWLDGYPGLSAALEQQTEAMLVRWSDYLQASGYLKDSFASNYGAADYTSEAFTALALAQRDPVNGPRLMNAVLSLRQNQLVPLLQNPTTSLNGGFWSEGWSYGSNAAQTMLQGSLALEQAGKITATPERQWADQVVEDLVSEQPATDQLYDGGDWYAYPSRMPDRPLLYMFGYMADNAADRAYANYILQNYPDAAFLTAGDSNDYRNILFHNPTAPAQFWSSLPLQDFATGTGLLTARSDWGANPTWLSEQMGNLLRADHQTYSPGQLQISRGDD